MPFDQFPQPPVDLVMPQTAQSVVLLLMSIAVVIVLIRSLRVLTREGDIIPLLLMVGGGLCVFLEPIVDVMGLVWVPVEGQWTIFETFGRPMPHFALAGYLWFIGGQAAVARLVLFRPGYKLRKLLLLFAAFMTINLVMEIVAVSIGVWVYYGAQPFSVSGFPLWWLPVNALMSITVAVMVQLATPYLHGWRIAGVIALVPMGDILTNAAVAWPVWSALNTNHGYFLTYFGAVATFVLVALSLYLYHCLLEHRQSRAGDRPTLDAAQGIVAAVDSRPR